MNFHSFGKASLRAIIRADRYNLVGGSDRICAFNYAQDRVTDHWYEETRFASF